MVARSYIVVTITNDFITKSIAVENITALGLFGHAIFIIRMWTKIQAKEELLYTDTEQQSTKQLKPLKNRTYSNQVQMINKYSEIKQYINDCGAISRAEGIDIF